MKGTNHDHICWSCIHYRQHPHVDKFGQDTMIGFCFNQWPDYAKKTVSHKHTCPDFEPSDFVRGGGNGPDPKLWREHMKQYIEDKKEIIAKKEKQKNEWVKEFKRRRAKAGIRVHRKGDRK